jgi:hypothetical protein
VVQKLAATMTECEKSTVEMLERLGREGATEHQRRSIIETAETTHSSRIRSAAGAGAAQTLIRSLGKKETKNASGSILYALEEMGTKVPLSLIVHLLIEENYEGREQALDILSKGQVVFAKADLEAAVSSPASLAASDDEHSQMIGSTALNWLSKLGDVRHRATSGT